MAKDPFATDDVQDDPFAQPASGGSFPKAEELANELIMLSNFEIEGYVGKYTVAGETDMRLSADTVVLTGENIGSWDGMWWSQKTIVKAGQKAIKKNQTAILGRLRRYPQTEYSKKTGNDTWQAVEDALNDPQQMRHVKFAWGLENFTPDDAVIARAYLAENK